MAWVHIVLLTLLPTILILTVLSEVEGAAVKDEKDSEASGPSKRVFMPASDASNFFKRRGRRSPKSHAEYFGEFHCDPTSTNNSPVFHSVLLNVRTGLQHDKARVRFKPTFGPLNLTDHTLLEKLAHMPGDKCI
uniref:Unique cartilage matrix-associated protein n=1 Tax=Astyanax mexicanus TaxID=7994 RepID=A0A3B1IY43_ASTMX